MQASNSLSYGGRPIFRKSRTGCLICKRRRVKCDERRPSCSNCERYGCICTFGSQTNASKQDPTEKPPSSASLSPTSARRGATRAGKTVNSCSSSSRNLDQQNALTQGLDDKLWCQEMELLHHYTTITAGTISLRHDMAHTWRVTIPQQGYRKRFVTHGVLAMGAAHKAVLEPGRSKTYLQMCDYHATLGSEQFRSELEDVRPDNWMALFSFASLVTLYAFTLPSRLGAQTLPNPLANIIEMVTLLRGIETALSPLLTRISKSEFAPLIYGARLATPDELSTRGTHDFDSTYLPADTLAALKNLGDFLNSQLPHSCHDAYQRAVVSMEDMAKLIALAGYDAEAGIVLGWLFGLPETLLPDIDAQKSHALILMSYFAVFIKSLESKFWYSRRWARQVFDHVESEIGEEGAFQDVLSWPRDAFWKETI
ncbi:Sterol regulatory element-binding ECM22 [Fusarium albosuccineum]|uniref:Sterol regulatory element-binding ECM22 n=1 Tax=Fusarium albosuccineum TaxID=1237068 RepID=A0A8H4LFC2_9HYPO|nr:Sterol regulatory element-binding ECM22 [Fusarium albosuccineum]